MSCVVTSTNMTVLGTSIRIQHLTTDLPEYKNFCGMHWIRPQTKLQEFKCHTFTSPWIIYRIFYGGTHLKTPCPCWVWINQVCRLHNISPVCTDFAGLWGWWDHISPINNSPGVIKKNPLYRRHQLSWPMLIVTPYIFCW